MNPSDPLNTKITNHLNTQEHLQRGMTASKIVVVLSGIAAVAGVAVFAYFHFSSLGSTIASHSALYGASAATALGIIGIAAFVILRRKWELNENQLREDIYKKAFLSPI